jgi:hypothetical protein
MITIALLSSALAQDASPISINPWSGATFEFNQDGASLVASLDGPLGQGGRLAMQLLASTPAGIVSGEADGKYRFVFGLTTTDVSSYMEAYLEAETAGGPMAVFVEQCLEYVSDLEPSFVKNDWFNLTKLEEPPVSNWDNLSGAEFVSAVWSTVHAMCKMNGSSRCPTPDIFDDQQNDQLPLAYTASTGRNAIAWSNKTGWRWAPQASANNAFQSRDILHKGGPIPVQGFFRLEGEWDRQTIGTTTSPQSTSDWYSGTVSLSSGATGTWGYEKGQLTQFGFDSAFGIGRQLATELKEVCPKAADSDSVLPSGSGSCGSVDVVNVNDNTTSWNGRALLKFTHSGREISDKFAYVPGFDLQVGWRGDGHFEAESTETTDGPAATPTHRFEAQAAATFRSLSQTGVLIAAGVNVQYALGGDAELEGWNVKPVILFGTELPSIGAGQRAKGKQNQGDEAASQGASPPENPSNGAEPKTPQPNADKTSAPGADTDPEGGNAPEAKAP